MSKIDELIKQYCPNGVEYTTLGQICTLSRGRVMSKDYLRDNAGEYPVYSSQTANNGVFGRINTYDQDGTYITWTTDGAHAGSVFYRDNEKFSITNVCGLITNNNPEQINLRFLYYVLSVVAKSYVYSGMGNPKLMSNVMSTIKIPVPPLPVQEEIVDILDKFTKLEARQKQYAYYRDELLSFDEGEFEWKPLGDIGKFTYGYVAKAQDSGNARFIRITDINTDGKLIQTASKYVDLSEENERFLLKKNDLLMARTGATFGKTMIFEEDYPAIYAGFLIKLGLDKKVIDPKFYWHFAQSNFFWNQANKLVSGGGQPQFNANVLKEVKIPIPYANDPEKSLAEQARIVAILDKFDALVNDIFRGLPAEITARRQQYEHDRNQLLTFTPPAGGQEEAA